MTVNLFLKSCAMLQFIALLEPNSAVNQTVAPDNEIAAFVQANLPYTLKKFPTQILNRSTPTGEQEIEECVRSTAAYPSLR